MAHEPVHDLEHDDGDVERDPDQERAPVVGGELVAVVMAVVVTVTVVVIVIISHGDPLSRRHGRGRRATHEPQKR